MQISSSNSMGNEEWPDYKKTRSRSSSPALHSQEKTVPDLRLLAGTGVRSYSLVLWITFWKIEEAIGGYFVILNKF